MWILGLSKAFFLFVCFVLVLIGSHYVAQVGLKLATSCLSLPSAGISGAHHDTWLKGFVFKQFHHLFL
jgi:autotransporter translocation and assembly factor TamB